MLNRPFSCKKERLTRILLFLLCFMGLQLNEWIILWTVKLVHIWYIILVIL